MFADEPDHQRFVEALAEACGKTGWEIHAYVLMPNYFHLVVKTPHPNLVAGMKWFLESQPKGAAEKVALAVRLREETTMTAG